MALLPAVIGYLLKKGLISYKRGSQAPQDPLATPLTIMAVKESTILSTKIMLIARREEALKKVVPRCGELGAETATYFVADLSSLEAAKSLAAVSELLAIVHPVYDSLRLETVEIAKQFACSHIFLAISL